MMRARESVFYSGELELVCGNTKKLVHWYIEELLPNLWAAHSDPSQEKKGVIKTTASSWAY